MVAVFWDEVPDVVDEWLLKIASPAEAIRRGTSRVFTRGDVGYYWNPDKEIGGLHGREATAQDLALCTAALTRAVGADQVLPEPLTFPEVSSGHFVKVAYSPTLRRAGELLNFFPGKYPGGIPNAPSPLAATLTGGLVGAGLGYGAGWLGEKLLPSSWRRGRLRRTLALIGGLTGSTPGAMWTLSALSRGRSLTDGSDLAGKPGDKPVNETPAIPVPTWADKPAPLWRRIMASEDYTPADYGIGEYEPLKEACDVLAGVELGQRYTQATEKFASLGTFSRPSYTRIPPGPLTVNTNKMGQTLWEVGASPQTAATTMGALYAAQQMPDSNSQPGQVTPHQTGLLGTMMGAAGGGVQGYAAGWAVGKALGLLTGMPAGTQNTLKRSGAILGVINAVVPRLFR